MKVRLTQKEVDALLNDKCERKRQPTKSSKNILKANKQISRLSKQVDELVKKINKALGS
ncbi:MAG: hypothetical protein H6625_08700 [Bdellovibrionaceae bacterium]|nr:hypothetical protein [Pseudobdellovibrionaceae bacterium]